MQVLQNRNLATLLIAVLGAVKLILQAFGIDIITSQQIDAIANGVAALITVAGVIMTHLKKSAGASTGAGAQQTGANTSQSAPTITHSERSESESSRGAPSAVSTVSTASDSSV
ncbi:hypothetical protein [Alicyclobacillus ferrooxydans]|uniref:Uncharacterized protein n=1 Tax=Alicyclobacillus ferrooxydans TaxID=471514 RepID=A0A0P9EQ01_9BACL|nr:hypothetical protein [Alicyclobacillus ferrooxydans]KPV45582.1 hypothetical protein AN477_01240 [Alicyclobacillus ferrooxydans]